jgi:hypothetical protein
MYMVMRIKIVLYEYTASPQLTFPIIIIVLYYNHEP